MYKCYNYDILFQLIPVISSLTPITTLLPLVGVLTITGLKDAYDDLVRTYPFIFMIEDMILTIHINVLIADTVYFQF